MNIAIPCRSFAGAVWTGMVALICISAQSQSLFEADESSGHIYEFAPNGAQSTFASGLAIPFALAFDNTGNLFEADAGSGTIYKYTPNGTQSTFFASEPFFPVALAFNSAGDLFAGCLTDDNESATGGYILEITPSGVKSTFASSFGEPRGLAFQPGTGLPAGT
ncbi:MAG: hypothetical protein WBN22_07875 [Verrucomicrobiia bacterium]